MGIKQAVKKEPDFLPGENPASAPVGIGHNKPPLEELIPQEFRTELLGEKADFFVILERYLGRGDPNAEDYVEGAVDRAKCTSEEELGRCGEVINALRKIDQIVTGVHKRVKDPYLTAGRLVDAEKNALVGRILAGRDRVQGKMNDYAFDQREIARKAELQRQEDRRRLEELARENNVEAVLPPPPPPPPKAEPIRSDGGATVSLGTEWRSTVEDYVKAFKHVKNDAKVREAIDAAIQRLVKATKGNNDKPLAGVRMFEAAKVSAR